MKKPPSLRARLLLASLMWTTGLLYVAHMATVLFVIGPNARVFGDPHRFGPLSIGAVLLMVAGALIVRRNLRAFRVLRERLADVHSGRARAVTGVYPSEVQPLVDDLNALLEHQDRRVKDAIAKAGDLAHGLKTPLAVLQHEASRAAAEGHADLAAALHEQVARMRRQLDFHLAHARAAASGTRLGMRCAVSDSALGIIRALQRLHAERGLSIEAAIDRAHVVVCEREMLDEMLGNLLDNACKFARQRVLISSHRIDRAIEIRIDDDGPGIASELRDKVLQRGVRADERIPGTGLGLAIVHDLAQLYGGSITLDVSPVGGLRAVLRLPAAQAGIPPVQ